MSDSEQVATIQLLLAGVEFWNTEAGKLSLPAVDLEVTGSSGKYEWNVTWRDGSVWLSSNSHGLLRSQQAAKEDMQQCLRDKLLALLAKTTIAKSTLR